MKRDYDIYINEEKRSILYQIRKYIKIKPGETVDYPFDSCPENYKYLYLYKGKMIYNNACTYKLKKDDRISGATSGNVYIFGIKKKEAENIYNKLMRHKENIVKAESHTSGVPPYFRVWFTD